MHKLIITFAVDEKANNDRNDMEQNFASRPLETITLIQQADNMLRRLYKANNKSLFVSNYIYILYIIFNSNNFDCRHYKQNIINIFCTSQQKRSFVK